MHLVGLCRQAYHDKRSRECEIYNVNIYFHQIYLRKNIIPNVISLLSTDNTTGMPHLKKIVKTLAKDEMEMVWTESPCGTSEVCLLSVH
jgi:hypothetical protein